MRRAKILIVEDEVIVADSIKNNLIKHGYRVVSLAASGEMALQIAEKENPDLVLMDIVLKGELDGINAADQIRKQLGIPVIFLTAYSDNEIFQSAKITEPFGYITKPFDDKQLVLSIEIALYKSELEKEKEKLVKALQKEITERKKVAEILQESEEKFRNAFENANTGMCLIDLDYNLKKVNNKMCDIFGYSNEELESMTVNDITHPEDLNISSEFYKKAISGKTKGIVFKKRYIHKKGHTIWGLVSSSLVQDSNRDPLYFISQVQDITTKKIMEMEIKELAKFPSEDPFPVLRVRNDGTILYANNASQPIMDTWGCRIDQVLTGCWLDMVMEVQSSGLKKQINVEYNDRVFNLTLAPIAETDYVNIYGIDITEIESAKRQILLEHQKLRSLAGELSRTENRERRRIASFLHDQIGQALVVINMKFGELKVLEDSPKKIGLIDNIRDMLTQTIENTRSLTFELSPPILYELGFEPAIEWICEKMSENYGLLIEFKSDHYPKPVDDDLGTLLFCSVRELLINITKHAHANSVNVNILREGDFVTTYVEDDGVGFDLAKLSSHLWNKMGFGIFNIRERMLSVDGYFKIESKPGHGTRVSISVPLKSDDSSGKGRTP